MKQTDWSTGAMVLQESSTCSSRPIRLVPLHRSGCTLNTDLNFAFCAGVSIHVLGHMYRAQRATLGVISMFMWAHICRVRGNLGCWLVFTFHHVWAGTVVILLLCMLGWLACALLRISFPLLPFSWWSTEITNVCYHSHLHTDSGGLNPRPHAMQVL